VETGTLQFKAKRKEKQHCRQMSPSTGRRPTWWGKKERGKCRKKGRPAFSALGSRQKDNICRKRCERAQILKFESQERRRVPRTSGIKAYSFSEIYCMSYHHQGGRNRIKRKMKSRKGKERSMAFYRPRTIGQSRFCLMRFVWTYPCSNSERMLRRRR
jgi:hypothetical protein